MYMKMKQISLPCLHICMQFFRIRFSLHNVPCDISLCVLTGPEIVMWHFLNTCTLLYPQDFSARLQTFMLVISPENAQQSFSDQVYLCICNDNGPPEMPLIIRSFFFFLGEGKKMGILKLMILDTEVWNGL